MDERRGVSDPASDVLRAYIEAQICPWCGSGPHKRLAAHTQTAHQILGRELRRLAGLPSKASICSPEDSEASREHLVGLPNREEMTKRGNEAANAVGAIREAHKASVAKTMAANAAKHDRIVELYGRRALIRDIAADVGMHPSAVVLVLRRRGIASGPLLTERYENEDYARQFSAATRRGAAKTAVHRRSKREARILEFLTLGGDAAAVDTAARRWGISRKSTLRFLRQSSIHVGD